MTTDAPMMDPAAQAAWEKYIAARSAAWIAWTEGDPKRQSLDLAALAAWSDFVRIFAPPQIAKAHDPAIELLLVDAMADAVAALHAIDAGGLLIHLPPEHITDHNAGLRLMSLAQGRLRAALRQYDGEPS